MPSEPAADLLLRPATRDDLPRVADVYVAARDAAVPAMPPSVHSAQEVGQWVRSWDLARKEIWLAERDAALLGFAAVDGDWLESLYVHPDRAGSGVGSALLDLVKGIRPGGFSLWVFASNERARGFYAGRGLVELEHTDGSANEERSPDLRMAWPGVDPLRFLRRQIDEADEELGRLLARRVALTTAVQRHKEVPGEAGRDAAREEEIARRVAHHVPTLGEERVRRIVHAIISESLDADRG